MAKIKTPAVGTMVQFYHHGIKENNQPVAAVVTESGEDGLVRLSLFYPYGGDIISLAEYIHHISDPWVKANEHKLRLTNFGIRGAWDYVPDEAPKKERKYLGKPEPAIA